MTFPISDIKYWDNKLAAFMHDPLSKEKVKTIYQDLLKALKLYIGTTDDQTGYSGKFAGDPESFAKARFFYTLLRLRFVLSENNVSSLGAFWHRIPADSRFPDHSIWQHNSLAAAFYSCMEIADNKDDVGMMVFSITPVQAFIGKARKLRDYWSGSVILSWLAFEGIRWVCENLGPDHILYPSLIDQPLIDEYLKTIWKMDDLALKPTGAKDIASLPNKFLFLIPQSKANEIGSAIEECIKLKWIEFCNLNEKLLKNILKLETESENKSLSSMFKRQAHNYWDFDWASVKLLSNEKESRQEMEKYIPETLYKEQSGLLDIFNEIIKDKTYYDKSGKGVFYSVTHSMVQSVLAASKNIKISDIFHKNETFPSTTEISLFNYYRKCKIDDSLKQRQLAQDLYDNSSDILNSSQNKSLTDRDKYYAILMMDGDKMGKLVNGSTLASTWKSVLYPEIYTRLNQDSFDSKYKNNWKKIFDKYPRRLLTPAIHSAISESLGDFAIYGVASIVKNCSGRLIYAGGDDVCAVLPVDTVFNAAQRIQKYYNAGFQIIQPDGVVKQVKDKWLMDKGKLSINLGTGDGISISAGILICHHKENLSIMIARAHTLLDTMAKEKAQRDACAIELKKRSGGSRYFVRKWNDKAWESFATIGKASGDTVKNIEAVSRSLVYRLEYFRDGIEAIIKSEENKDNKLLVAFIKKQLERSSIGKGDREEFSKKIADIIIETDQNNKPEFKPEGLIVGAFLFGGKTNENMV